MLHKETVKPELLEVLKLLMSMDQLAAFRLVGGTAIALQLGHRKSIDIDLFSNQKSDLKSISQSLKNIFLEISNLTLTQNYISVLIKEVRVDIYDDWSIPFKKSPIVEEGIRLSALEDLAAFKLSTIIGRREKKDFIDLFFLFKQLPASQVLNDFKTYEPLLSAKSLLFALSEVDTACENNSPMPNMLIKADWDEIKKSMIEAAKSYIQIIENSK